MAIAPDPVDAPPPASQDETLASAEGPHDSVAVVEPEVDSDDITAYDAERAVREAASAQRIHMLTSVDRHARWLLWIAGFSLVNIAMTIGGGDVSFAIGLFGAQLVAILGNGIADEAAMPAIAWVGAGLATLPAIATGLLYLPARRGERWALTIAITVYTLDVLLLVGVGALAGTVDILGIGIHVWALVSLVTGWTICGRLAASAQ